MGIRLVDARFWPLWDPRNQTLADKVVGTVVVIQPADSTK